MPLILIRMTGMNMHMIGHIYGLANRIVEIERGNRSGHRAVHLHHALSRVDLDGLERRGETTKPARVSSLPDGGESLGGYHRETELVANRWKF